MTGRLSTFRLSPYCASSPYPCRWLEGSARLGKGCVIRGGKDARERKKKKTRQKGLVQSPSLCSVLWFTGLEHSHPGPSAWGQPQQPAAVGMGRAGLSGGGGSGGSGAGGTSVFPVTLEIAER